MGASDAEWVATRALNAAAAFTAGTWDIEVTLIDRAGNETVDVLGSVDVSN